MTDIKTTATLDPIAQTFYVAASTHPMGMFIESIDVFFRNKDTVFPVEMQIRPCIPGDIPSSTQILPGAVKVLQPEEIKVSDNPNIDDPNTYTRFRFPSPVYVEPGLFYSFVVITNSFNYDIYVSELGGTVIGTNRIVSKQPNIGSMFKSQNGRLFTPIQTEDLMFSINKCVFETSGSIILRERKSPIDIHGLRANTNADMLYLRSDYYSPTGTYINMKMRTTDQANGFFSTEYQRIEPDENIELNSRKIVYGETVETDSVEFVYDLYTPNPDVSPIIYHDRQELVAIQNEINNMGITNTDIYIVNGGSGYSNGDTSITFTSPTGQGANAFIEANSSTGAIEKVIMDSEGFGYFDNVDVSVTGNGTGAVIMVNSELSRSGGLAAARYITRPVSLKDGFAAGDLKLQLTAIKPAGSNVAVYYKIRNSLDALSLNELNWNKMEMETSPYNFSTEGEPIELEFKPSLSSNSISYTSGTTTYNTFNQFQIKVVLSAPNTLVQNSPSLLDLRVIALPGDEF